MNKPYVTGEIEFLIKKFQNQILLKSDWTHEAHLIVGIWYSWHFEETEALNLVRNRIREYNISVGTANTDSAGYHETITVFWLWTARSFLKFKKYKSVSEACNDFINSDFSKKELPLTYYSKTLLFSKNARLNFVKPDIKNMTELPMKSGETNLQTLLKNAKPELHPGEYVFVTLPKVNHIPRLDTLMEFKESEGITLILERQKADSFNLKYSFVAAWITLTVHSALEAVGLTAAFSSALGKNEISCNVVAGFYHDHIFVGKEDAEKAMEVLGNL